MNKVQKIIARLLIPRGAYCDGCPFHFRDWSKPEQENGYCSYMGVSDWEEQSSLSLLWDGCKECGVKVTDWETWEDYWLRL